MNIEMSLPLIRETNMFPYGNKADRCGYLWQRHPHNQDCGISTALPVLYYRRREPPPCPHGHHMEV